MSDTLFPFFNSNSDKVALVEGENKHTYSEVNDRINLFSSGILGAKEDLNEERIAFFLPASLDYVTAMHGVWRAGVFCTTECCLRSLGTRSLPHLCKGHKIDRKHSIS